ncbi:3'-5' exoribonuclease, partial [Pseudomonas aeruginosa]|uniref:3'-5' exoribonuclease n=1 Tax=Pseudomonas aeruginosa TaxID=287 RepID=UPI000DC4059E
MSKYYFDTEFHGLHLISVGVVCEDGREFYAETPTARTLASLTPWLVNNVYVHLDDVNIRTEAQIAGDLFRLVSGDKNPEFRGYFADYDWVLICECFGGMLHNPLGHLAYDIAQEARRLGIRFQTNTPRHKAIDCARWTK